MSTRKYATGLRAVATSVNHVIGPIRRRRGLAETDLVAAWPNIVGATLANQCYPQRLVRDRGRLGGALHVAVAGPLALELQHLAPQVIERINTYFGHGAVDRLVLRQVPPRRPAPTKSAPQRPAADPPGLIERLRAIHDPDLRRALHGLGRAVLPSHDRENRADSG